MLLFEIRTLSRTQSEVHNDSLKAISSLNFFAPPAGRFEVHNDHPIAYSQTSLDGGFQKNLGTSEPTRETGQNLRSQIRENDERRNRNNRKDIVPQKCYFLKFTP